MTILDRVRRYGFALLMLILGAALLAVPMLREGAGTPVIVLFFVILLAAWYGGLGPGLMITGLIAAITAPPDLAPWRIARLALFLAGGVSISILAEILHAARRRAEESRRALAAVLTSIGDAVVATDARGRLTFANPVAATLTGWAPEEAAGRPLAEVFKTADEATRHPSQHPIAGVLLDGLIVGPTNHTLLIARDGTERAIHHNAAPIRDGSGAIVGAVLVFRDDSVRREHERALMEESRRKDEFLAMLAHEIRNPLGTIQSAVTLLGTPEADLHLNWARDVLERQVAHLGRLLDDLLDVARISRGRIVLRPEIVDVAAAIDRAVDSVRPLIADRGHQVEVSISGGSKRVEADPVRLEQVLVNLLNNAARYTPDGGRIRVLADEEGADVAIRVVDNGPGIPPEILPGIFEAFAQGERSPARTEGGLGLGLTIVKGLVEQHGGRVEAKSPGPGQGSEFVVRLPMSPSVPMPPAVSEPPASPPRNRGARILIVDDNKDLARGLARILRHLGHEVEMAHDGPEGIVAARAYGPEVLLLDIGLPSLDGYEVARQLRGDDDFRRALFIAISGYGQEEDRRRSREAGIDHHLLKPVAVETLVGLIEQPRVSA